MSPALWNGLPPQVGCVDYSDLLVNREASYAHGQLQEKELRSGGGRDAHCT
ncbi:MAG: hypothetical protein KME55_23575 [Nostoc indistinguendum CM1-VF10]|nr:hypothetical protein [Nostoc indistinguendum CM1-VF10]